MERIIELQRREYANWNSIKLKEAYNSGLRIVILNSMGSDPFPIESAKRIGLIVKTLPDYCSDELSSHAFNMLIQLARKVGYKGFSNKTALIIGSEGNVGKKVCSKSLDRSFKVLKHDIALGHTEKDLLTKLKKSDFVFLCIPLNKRSNSFLRKEHFEAMQKKPLVINVSGRTGLVNSYALLKALRENLISGYACDESVYERRFFYQDHKLLFTPHIGWRSKKSEKKREELLKQLWKEAKQELNYN